MRGEEYKTEQVEKYIHINETKKNKRQPRSCCGDNKRESFSASLPVKQRISKGNWFTAKPTHAPPLAPTPTISIAFTFAFAFALLLFGLLTIDRVSSNVFSCISCGWKPFYHRSPQPSAQLQLQLNRHLNDCACSSLLFSNHPTCELLLQSLMQPFQVWTRIVYNSVAFPELTSAVR